MRAFRRPRAALLPGRGARRAGERRAPRRAAGGAVAVRALILGGARSGKSFYAEGLAENLGGRRVLYAATAAPGDDPELAERVRLHRERRPASWGTVENFDLAEVAEQAGTWDAVLLDSLTLWVSARLYEAGEEAVYREVRRFLERAAGIQTPFVIVSDEVGLGVVPASAEGRLFRDVLGAVNQRVAAAAGEVHLCVAGVGVRIK